MSVVYFVDILRIFRSGLGVSLSLVAAQSPQGSTGQLDENSTDFLPTDRLTENLDLIYLHQIKALCQQEDVRKIEMQAMQRSTFTLNLNVFRGIRAVKWWAGLARFKYSNSV